MKSLTQSSLRLPSSNPVAKEPLDNGAAGSTRGRGRFAAGDMGSGADQRTGVVDLQSGAVTFMCDGWLFEARDQLSPRP